MASWVSMSNPTIRSAHALAVVLMIVLEFLPKPSFDANSRASRGPCMTEALADPIPMSARICAPPARGLRNVLNAGPFPSPPRRPRASFLVPSEPSFAVSRALCFPHSFPSSVWYLYTLIRLSSWIFCNSDETAAKPLSLTPHIDVPNIHSGRYTLAICARPHAQPS